MMGNIFNKHYINDYVAHHHKTLAAEIDGLEITDKTNLEQLVERLQTKYTITPLTLKDPIPSTPVETYRDRQNDWGQSYKQKIFEINVTIPFEGRSDLFYVFPSTSTVIYLDKDIRINPSTVTAKITLEELNSTTYQSFVQKIISDLSSNIPRVNAEIQPYNNGLENHIRHLLEQRKGLVSKKFDFMEQIGLKVNPKSDEFMVPPPIAKKPVPTPVAETAAHIKKDLIPVLQEAVYKDIIEVLYNVGKAIERKPSLYLNKHEEDLRDVFLLFLETRYESTSGVGEAFNKSGRTDILLKYTPDGTNLFVAECKFWKGKKVLLDALDQLLRYLTHRDSKTALMVFLDQKDFTNVIQTLKTEIKTHPQFKRHVKDSYGSSISYEFYFPDDIQNTILVEVMLFHFPK